MSEPQGAPAPVIPVVTPPAATAAPPAAPMAPAPAPTASAITFSSTEQLTERLDRAKAGEREALFKELGVTDLAAAKAAIAAANAAAEAGKTAEQRAAEAATREAATKAENARQAGIIAEHAGRMMMALDADKQAAVKAAIKSVGGNPDDPTAQLGAISALSSTWNAAPVAPAAASPAAPVPGNTAPPPNAPPAAGSVSPTDPQAVYQSMAKQNPLLAAAYGISHMRDVYKTPNT